MTWLLVAAGGAIGAVIRQLLDQLAGRQRTLAMPVGILIANVMASGLLGWLVASTSSAQLLAFAGAGVCGSMSTYSTFALGCLDGAGRHPIAAPAYAVLTPVLCVAAAALGLAVGTG